MHSKEKQNIVIETLERVLSDDMRVSLTAAITELDVSRKTVYRNKPRYGARYKDKKSLDCSLKRVVIEKVKKAM